MPQPGLVLRPLTRLLAGAGGVARHTWCAAFSTSGESSSSKSSSSTSSSSSSDSGSNAGPRGGGEAELLDPAARHGSVVGEIAAALESLGLSPGIGCVVGDGLATVDVGVLVGDPPTQVAIDVDTVDGGGHNAAARTKQRVLEHFGWRGARLRAEDWASLSGDAELQRRFLGLVIGAALEDGASHGGGHVCGSGCKH